MKIKVFRSAIMALVVICATLFNVLAQQIIAAPVVPPVPAVAAVPALQPVIIPDVIAAPNPVIATKINGTVKVNLHKLKKQIEKLNANVQGQVSSIINNINLNVNLDSPAPQVALGFKDGINRENIITEEPQNDGDQFKIYTKVYPADANDQLVIDNRYGSVIVNTWNRNEFKVSVEIRATNNNEAARKMLDNINISDAKDGSTVAFRTNIGNVNGSWLSRLSGGHSNSGMEINYTVYMPAKNELVIDNSYGPIVLPDLYGKVTINSAYGSLSAKTLSNQSAIRVKYGSASIVGLGTAALDISYSGLNIGSVDKLDANINYCSGAAKIGRIHTSASINFKYGESLQIGDLDKNMNKLAINASYGDVRIGLSGDENASFDVTVRYNEFTYNDHDVTITSKSPNDNDRGPHFTKSYKGYIGKGDSDRTIAINSSYGGVKFD